MAAGAEVLPLDSRRDALQHEVNRYVRKGYRVVSQTDTTAQLVKPKKFSFIIFLLLVLTIGGWLLYLAWYLGKRDKTVYLEVDASGRVTRQS